MRGVPLSDTKTCDLDRDCKNCDRKKKVILLGKKAGEILRAWVPPVEKKAKIDEFERSKNTLEQLCGAKFD